MKVKIILLVLIFNIFLINGVLAESNVQNVTLEIHQLWDFSNEIDASVTETIYSNENWTYYDHICFDPNSEFINYFVYKDDFEIPEIRIYRPIIYESTTLECINVPEIFIKKNETIKREYTFLRVSAPCKLYHPYLDRNILTLDNRLFPFDKYYFSLKVKVEDINQKYSADIIFPASFEIDNITITSPISKRLHEDQNIIIFRTGYYHYHEIYTSILNEENKFVGHIPLIEIPTKSQIDNEHYSVQSLNNSYLEIKFLYGRPDLFKMVFFVSILIMLGVTYYSYPLNKKEKINKYLLTIVSIWAGQEGVSFLQGHRPLNLTLFDLTIVIIFIPFIPNLIYLLSRKKSFIFKMLVFLKNWIDNKIVKYKLQK